MGAGAGQAAAGITICAVGDLHGKIGHAEKLTDGLRRRR